MDNKEIIEKIDINFQQIYYEMNCMLVQSVYYETFGQEKKDVFLKIFKIYLLKKLKDVGVNSFSEESSILEIVEYISKIQPDQEKLANLVHYMMSAVGDFQGWESVWEINKEFSEEERELHVHHGILDKFETGRKCDIYKSFAILYCFFTDSLVLSDQVKKLELN